MYTVQYYAVLYICTYGVVSGVKFWRFSFFWNLSSPSGSRVSPVQRLGKIVVIIIITFWIATLCGWSSFRGCFFPIIKVIKATKLTTKRQILAQNDQSVRRCRLRGVRKCPKLCDILMWMDSLSTVGKWVSSTTLIRLHRRTQAWNIGRGVTLRPGGSSTFCPPFHSS